jgi:hypothetical protein
VNGIHSENLLDTVFNWRKTEYIYC